MGLGVGVHEYDYEHAAGGRWDGMAGLYALIVRSNELLQVDRMHTAQTPYFRSVAVNDTRLNDGRP